MTADLFDRPQTIKDRCEHRLPDDAKPEAEKKGFVVLHE